MSSTQHGGRSEASEPRRTLRSDFTGQVLRNAATAKQRAHKQQRFKELFTMKTFNFLRTIPGAALAVAVVAASGVGVYALNNWFGGSVAVTQDTASTFSVDLSSCQGNLPPGFESTQDRSKVQFKITGNPHISAPDLQKQLLGQCEESAVTEFYAKLFPDAGFSSTGHPADSTNGSKYTLLAASIKSIGKDGTVTLSSTGTKGWSFGTTDAHGNFSPVKTFRLASDVTIYREGGPAGLGDLKGGDNIEFVAHSASAADFWLEGTSLLDNDDAQIVSIFRTQYDDGNASFNYPEQNVMPLNVYDSIHNPEMKTEPLVR